VVYRDILPEGRTGDFLGTGSQLYVVSVETGVITRIGRADELWRDPQVSPDGTMIAAVGGSGFSDACMSDRYAGILLLDENMQRRDVLRTGGFAGIPGDFAEISLQKNPRWISETAVEVGLGFDCMGTPEDSGIYSLDIPTRTATQTQQVDAEFGPYVLGSFINFTTDPASQYSEVRSFPAGTQRIYAQVSYESMADGMLFRREWYLNGEPWLTREEAWDFAKYSESGTLTDLSVFDDAGLPPGTYELRLYLDGVPQFNVFTGFGERSFVIEEEQ
jgi:hypothetical protein